jgi:sugar lactone lactonase YvrE
MKIYLLFFAFSICSLSITFAQRNGVPNFKIVSDFTGEHVFTEGIEGPAVDSKGYLYVVNFQKEGTIGVVDYFGNASLYVELPEGSNGNSIVIDNNTEIMYVADYTKHNILQIDMKTKLITVFAHNSNFSQPNDICRNVNGVFYASDPKWSENKGRVWYISPTGNSRVVWDNLGPTNGIAFSPDGSILYVTEQSEDINGPANYIWKFDVRANGNIVNKELLMTFRDFGMDGMKVDKLGNIYLSRYGRGTIAIISPQGNIIREINLKGKKPTNIVFGGMDGRTCYVTMQDRGCIEMFRMPKLD